MHTNITKSSPKCNGKGGPTTALVQDDLWPWYFLGSGSTTSTTERERAGMDEDVLSTQRLMYFFIMFLFLLANPNAHLVSND